MPRFLTTTLSLGLFLLIASPSVSKAGIIYTNFGPGLAYDTSGGQPVGNAFDLSLYAEGSSFTTGTAVQFSSLSMALSCFFTCPSAFTVALNQDVAGEPGTVIESFSFLGPSLGALGDNNPLVVFNSSLLPTLSTGQQYWITVKSDDTNSIAWNWNSTGDVSSQALSSDGGGTWFAPSGLTPGAFEVDGNSVTSTVPEPGSFALGALGLFLLLVRRHTTRFARSHPDL